MQVTKFQITSKNIINKFNNFEYLDMENQELIIYLDIYTAS